MSNEIYSRCGQRCDLCLVYRPNVEKEDRRTEICAVFDKLGLGKFDPEKTICDGCQNSKKDDAIILTKECKARECVIEKKT